MPTARPGFAGAVLTGGSSTRMGRDKATLLVDGVAMAVRVAEALRRAGATRVACIGRAVPGQEHQADRHPAEGPLGGMLAALEWAGDELLVVAPCDLLAPDPDAFAALLDRLAAGDGLAVVAGAGEPLPVALRPAAAPVLGAAFAAGERSPRRALAALEPAVVPTPPAAIADADDPADLPPGAGTGEVAG